MASRRLLGLVALALLAACAGGQAAPTPAPVVQTVVVPATVVVRETVVVAQPAPTPAPAGGQRPAAKTVLRVGTGDSGEGLTPHQQIIEQFERENPDIQVQLEPVGAGDYYGRVMTQIEAGDPPDILQIGDDAVPMFVRRGAFIPLDDLIAGRRYPLDPGIYLPGVFAPGSYEGRQYLLPKDFTPLAVYYNRDLFDRFGVPYPKDGWTWEDFRRAAAALTRDTDGDGRTDVWGVQMPGAWTTGFEAWVAAAGGRLVSEDGRSFAGAMDSPEARSALAFYAGLYRDGLAPPPADIQAFGGGNTEFEDGRAAMRVFGRWPQAGLRKAGAFKLGVAPMPAGARRANVLFWSGFGISALSVHQEAAWRFLRFYAGAEGAQVWKGWALPTVETVADESGASRDPLDGVWIGELAHLAPRAYTATPYWGAAAEPALRDALAEALQDPRADPGELLRRAAQRAQQALGEQP